MQPNWLAEFLKLVPLLLAALLTAWLSDYYLRRRRREVYREHLFKERLKIYCELWQKYVLIARLLGTEGASSTAAALRMLTLSRGHPGVPSVTEESSQQNNKAEEILGEVESFIAFARGSYVILDPATLNALEKIIMLIEGKSIAGSLVIDWGELHRRSLDLRRAIRRELGIDELREIDEIIGRDRARDPKGEPERPTRSLKRTPDGAA